MAYVTIRGRAPNRMQLSQYARFVRGMSGLGMGQDGTDLSSLPVGGMSPTDTSLIGLAPPSGSDVLGSLGINISGLDPTAVPGAVAAASAPSSGGGFNLSTFLNSLTGSAASAAKLYQQLQGPSLVAGTNAIYNNVFRHIEQYITGGGGVARRNAGKSGGS